MGNVWKGISEEKFVQAELELLKSGGLQVEKCIIGNMYTDDESNPEDYIHYIDLRNYLESDEPLSDDRPTLVFTHGWAGGIGVFFMMIPDLARHFKVVVFDLLGMGGSGRPVYSPQSIDEGEEFFIVSMHKFIQKLGIQGKYYLGGHSMGGYFSAVYAETYPEEVEQLLLMSPAGIAIKPEELTKERMIENNSKRYGKFFSKFSYEFWERGYSPFSVVRATGGLGADLFFQQGLKRRVSDKVMKKEQMKLLGEYLKQINMRPPSSEYVYCTILSVGAWAKKPLYTRLPKLKAYGIKVHAFYGQNDEFDPSPFGQLLEEGLIEGSLAIVRHSNHNLMYQNPYDSTHKLLKAARGEGIAAMFQELKKKEMDAWQREDMVEANL